jgi:N-acetyl-D-muramate 6-phosphate phosphatase
LTTPIAFLWDFDGTLVDTRRRNYNVVQRLIAENTDRALERIPALASAEIYDRVIRGYVNWREVYTREFGFSEEETDRLGRLWSSYQLHDDTPADVFEGIGTVLSALGQVGHGIVSQNGRDQIRRALTEARLAHHFPVVVGCDDVDIRRQKPEPDGLLAGLERLTGFAPGCALYIGDHETDVRCARNAAQALAARGVAVDVISVAACFGSHAGPDEWTLKPDHVAKSPQQLVEIARSLGR